MAKKKRWLVTHTPSGNMQVPEKTKESDSVKTRETNGVRKQIAT